MKYKRRIEKLEAVTEPYLRYRKSVPLRYYQKYHRIDYRISDLREKERGEVELVPTMTGSEWDVPEDFDLIEYMRGGGEVPKEIIERIKVTDYLGENLVCVEYANHFVEPRLICSKNDWKDNTAAQDCSGCEGVRIVFQDQRWIGDLSEPPKCINPAEGIRNQDI